MNPGGRGCSEPRLRHCTPAWATEQDFISKKRKVQNQSTYSGILPISTPSAPPYNGFSPSCKSILQGTMTVLNPVPTQPVLTCSHVGLFLRSALIGTSSNACFTPEGPPKAHLIKYLRDTAETLQAYLPRTPESAPLA